MCGLSPLRLGRTLARRHDVQRRSITHRLSRAVVFPRAARAAESLPAGLGLEPSTAPEQRTHAPPLRVVVGQLGTQVNALNFARLEEQRNVAAHVPVHASVAPLAQRSVERKTTLATARLPVACSTRGRSTSVRGASS